MNEGEESGTFSWGAAVKGAISNPVNHNLRHTTSRSENYKTEKIHHLDTKLTNLLLHHCQNFMKLPTMHPNKSIHYQENPTISKS